MTTTAAKSQQILFKGPMVRALLNGNKTQTRRVVDRVTGLGQVTCFEGSETTGYDFALRDRRDMWNEFREDDLLKLCPYGVPGDELWVRETWAPVSPFDPSPETGAFYRADYLDDPHGPDGEKSPEGRYRTWCPSIHMPRWASRITLEVTGVRVERLNDISEADAIAEGCDVDLLARPELTGTVAKICFRHLWESINGPDSWDANPWVWVVEFKQVELCQRLGAVEK